MKNITNIKWALSNSVLSMVLAAGLGTQANEAWAARSPFQQSAPTTGTTSTASGGALAAGSRVFSGPAISIRPVPVPNQNACANQIRTKMSQLEIATVLPTTDQALKDLLANITQLLLELAVANTLPCDALVQVEAALSNVVLAMMAGEPAEEFSSAGFILNNNNDTSTGQPTAASGPFVKYLMTQSFRLGVQLDRVTAILNHDEDEGPVDVGNVEIDQSNESIGVAEASVEQMGK